jgi:hypothetical protein
MVRIAISAEAFEAIAATMPLGSVGYENERTAKGERLIWLEARGGDPEEPLTQAARLVGQLVQPCADGHSSEKSADKRENEKQAHGRTPDQKLIKSRPRVSGYEAAARTKLSRGRGQRAAQQCRPSKELGHWP